MIHGLHRSYVGLRVCFLKQVLKVRMQVEELLLPEPDDVMGTEVVVSHVLCCRLCCQRLTALLHSI